MLIKPFTSLTSLNKETTDVSYIGTVEDNNDPQKLGRVRVNIPPYEDFLTEDLPWVAPMLSSSGNSSSNCALNVPEVGSQVRVSFPYKDLNAPYYTGAELNERNRTTFFDDDYPNSYGYRDPKGNFVRVNKAKETIELQHSSTTNAKVAGDGSIQISLSNGAYFTFSNSNSFELSTGSVKVSGTPEGSLDIKADMELSAKATSMIFDASMVQFTGDVSIGTGVSGSFWALGSLVTVKDGIIVSIA